MRNSRVSRSSLKLLLITVNTGMIESRSIMAMKVNG